MFLITPEIEAIIDRALAEDLSTGDPTTEALIPSELQGRGELLAKAVGVLAGIDVALAVFNRVDRSVETKALLQDGSTLQAGDVVATVEGRLFSILKAERTALNFLQRLSGISTETNKYVQAVARYRTRIIDTRKTTPGLRTLEKYAIRVGGGFNHRRNLGDGVLIKDNHIQALQNEGLDLGEIIAKARNKASHTLKVEVEVEDLEQVKEALEAGTDILMLDNMGLREMSEAVELARGKAVTEASGGINWDTLCSVAATGVDLISVGALTHSVKSLDISLDLL